MGVIDNIRNIYSVVGVQNLVIFFVLCRGPATFSFFSSLLMGHKSKVCFLSLQVGVQTLCILISVVGGATFSCFPSLQEGAQNVGSFILCRWGHTS